MNDFSCARPLATVLVCTDSNPRALSRDESKRKRAKTVNTKNARSCDQENNNDYPEC
jgi:hypothetical protein